VLAHESRQAPSSVKPGSLSTVQPFSLRTSFSASERAGLREPACGGGTRGVRGGHSEESQAEGRPLELPARRSGCQSEDAGRADRCRRAWVDRAEVSRTRWKGGARHAVEERRAQEGDAAKSEGPRDILANFQLFEGAAGAKTPERLTDVAGPRSAEPDAPKREGRARHGGEEGGRGTDTRPNLAQPTWLQTSTGIG